MTNLKSLPVDVIQVLVQHLDVFPPNLVPRSSARKDALSLASVCKRLRRAIFERIWVKEHHMEFTFEQIIKTKEVVQSAMRKNVKSLILRGSCDEKVIRPTLSDYVQIFPNLTSIKIDFVYPNNHPGTHYEPVKVAANRQSKATPATVKHCLKAVSLSITKDPFWYGTKHESFIAKTIPHVEASMKAAGIDRLDACHLEIATSRSKEDRESLTYWKDLGRKIKSACVIPAREVTLELGEVRMNGEVDRFLDTVVAAIKGWPKHVENIVIQVPTDDFIMESKNANKFKVDKKGRVTLAGGWIPTETMMIKLLNTLKKDRPSLRTFRLCVSVRSAAFTMVVCKQIFEFEYAKRDRTKPTVKKSSSTVGTKDKPIDVEDFVATSTSKTKRSAEPEYRIKVDQSVIQELYDAMKDFEEDSEMGDGDCDSYDEWEEEIAMLQGRDDEGGSFDEEDELSGLGGRPRWAAF